MRSSDTNIITLHSANNPTSAVTKGYFQRARLHYIENINRFLGDQDQRLPAGYGLVQTEDEAKAAGEARMSAYLRAFDVQFGSLNKPQAAKSVQE